MNELKGTQTAENLMKAFAGESQARNRYTMYSKIARKEGFRKISEIFAETAENERVHAKLFFKHLTDNGLNEETVTINAAYPAAISTTDKNLEYAANGEKEEWDEIYPSFADIADKEGFSEIARTFRSIAKIEKHHEERYRELNSQVKAGSFFKKADKTQWICLECGHIHETPNAPEICPVCAHPQAHFSILCEKY